MQVKHYRELIVWQKGMDLVECVYSITRTLPGHERYGLCQQLQRAAVSIPSNIAEGHQRNTRKDYLHFIAMARGSVAEVETQLLLLERLQYTSSQQVRPCLNLAGEVGRMLRTLAKRLSDQKPHRT